MKALLERIENTQGVEKTVGKAVLLSGSVLVLFMILIPIGHLSAQSEIKFDEKVKMRKATIESIDKSAASFTADVDGVEVPVMLNASTTVFLGNGDQVDTSYLENGVAVYVFGDYSTSTKQIAATKVVLRNQRITQRTTQSRAELESSKSAASKSPLDALGLTSK